MLDQKHTHYLLLNRHIIIIIHVIIVGAPLANLLRVLRFHLPHLIILLLSGVDYSIAHGTCETSQVLLTGVV